MILETSKRQEEAEIKIQEAWDTGLLMGIKAEDLNKVLTPEYI